MEGLQRWSEAEVYYRQMVTIEEKYEPESANHAIMLNNLGHCLMWQNKYKEAEKVLKESLRISRETISPLANEMALPLSNLANLALRQKQYQLAKNYFEEKDKVVNYTLTNFLPTMAENARKEFFLSKQIDFQYFYNLCIEAESSIPELRETLLNFRMKQKGLLFNSYHGMQEKIASSNDAKLKAMLYRMDCRKKSTCLLLIEGYR